MKYELKHALVKYADKIILNYVDFEVKDKEKVAVVGRNGCGKTTLLKLIAGILSLDNLDSDEECGIIKPKYLKVGYLEQMSFEDLSLTVEEELLKVFEPVLKLQERMKELALRMEKSFETNKEYEEILVEYGEVSNAFETRGGYSYQQDINIMIQKFGFILEDKYRRLDTFSGGQQTRIALIKLLLSRPDIMLLDEPTNHLDMETIEWLEEYLKNYNQAVVIVSHDRMFLDQIVDVTYELEYNKLTRYRGNYSYFLERKRLDAEKQEKDYIAQQKEIERLSTFVEQWKNTPTKVAMTRSKLKQIEHMDKIEKPKRFDEKAFKAQFSPRVEGGHEVLSVRKLQIGYDRVLSEVCLEVKRGQKIAIVGENGIGKSTFLKTLVKELEPISGSYRYGHDIEKVYYDQQMALYPSEKTVIDDFWDVYPTLTHTQVRTILGHFLFTQEDVYKFVSQLSGGERVRLYLAKLFQTKPNLLLLDEPTNHMDMIGKEALEQMLKSYTGTALFVTHDRYFVKEVANALLVFEKEQVTYYPYGWDEYKTSISNMKNQIFSEEKQSGNKSNRKSLDGNVSMRKKSMERLERQIEEQERLIEALQIELENPEDVSDYVNLSVLHERLEVEHEKLEELYETWDNMSLEQA